MLDAGGEAVEAEQEHDQDGQDHRPAADVPGGHQGPADPDLEGLVLVHEGRVDHDPEGQDHDHHRPEGEPERDQPLGDRQALVPVVVGGVEGAAGGGEQAAGQPPGEQQAADGRAPPLRLAELGPDERVDHPVGQPGADHDPDQRDGGVLAPGDLLRADEALDLAEGGADGHGQRDQGQHGEEGHLGGRAGDPVAQRRVEHVRRRAARGCSRRPAGGGATAHARIRSAGAATASPPR